MEQNDQTAKNGSSVIALPVELSVMTISEALDAHGYKCDNDIVMIECDPFEAVYVSEDSTCVVWEKDFSYSGGKEVTSEIFVEYLAYIMPGLYNVCCDFRGTAALAWAITGAETTTLGENVTGMSDGALRLINGETTIDQLWDELYTPENSAKIEALVRGPYVERDLLVRTIMENLPASFAHGEL